MRTFLDRYRVPPALGMTSLVLGHISLILALLPVLGVPLAAFGLVIGLGGLLFSLFGPAESLRWSLAGVTVCSLALLVTLTVYYVPYDYMPVNSAPRLWENVPNRPYIPPPAPPW